MLSKIILNLVAFFCLCCSCCNGDAPFPEYDSTKMYFATVADDTYYVMLQHCLSSLIKSNGEKIGHVAVFDLGLKEQQRNELNSQPFIHVYDIEPVNPFIFIYFDTRTYGKPARGWYSWKPVILKQALDMYPIVLYFDASIEFYKPLDLFFDHIRENGYLFVESTSSIKSMSTKSIFEKFQLDQPPRSLFVNKKGLEAAFQGLTREMYNKYVYPVYELAKDIKNFEDDGTAPGGFGFARHDQTLFSILAKILDLEIKPWRNRFALNIGEKRVPLNFSEYIGMKKLKIYKNKSSDPDEQTEQKTMQLCPESRQEESPG